MVKRLISSIRDYGIAYKSIEVYVDKLKQELQKEEICIGIDMMNIIYRYKSAKVEEECECGRFDYVIQLGSLLLKFMRYGVRFIACFEGKDIGLKQLVIDKKRRLSDDYCQESTEEPDEKKKYNHESKDIFFVKELCKVLHIQIIQSPGESDIVCGQLYKDKVIDAGWSYDGDLLAFGCDRLICIKEMVVTEFYLPTILHIFDITRKMFIEVCVLMGTHYAPYVPMIWINNEETEQYDAALLSQLNKRFTYTRQRLYHINILLTVLKEYGSLKQLFENDYKDVSELALEIIDRYDIDFYGRYVKDYENAINIYTNTDCKYCIPDLITKNIEVSDYMYFIGIENQKMRNDVSLTLDRVNARLSEKHSKLRHEFTKNVYSVSDDLTVKLN